MPTFSFECKNCERTWQDIVKVGEQSPCPNCKTQNSAKLPTQGMTVVMDTLDRNRGIKVRKDLDKKLKDRMNKHHDKYEVEHKIDEHGMATAERLGWTKKRKKV